MYLKPRPQDITIMQLFFSLSLVMEIGRVTSSAISAKGDFCQCGYICSWWEILTQSQSGKECSKVIMNHIYAVFYVELGYVEAVSNQLEYIRKKTLLWKWIWITAGSLGIIQRPVIGFCP